MNKVLIAFDGSHFSKGALAFAKQLNKKNPIFLIGVFLQGGSLLIPRGEEENAASVLENIKQFERFCHRNKIQYKVHKDMYDYALPELNKESRFADLLILSSECFYEQAGTEEMNDFLKEALHGVECPVIVVPETFDFPVTNILTYDGKKASASAIKQFAYLFPELAANETMLVYAGEKEKDGLPHQTGIEELATHHYSNLTLYRLEGDPKKHFVSWLRPKKAAIVISGAFGRSGIYRLFHESFVADVISEHRLPVFISHN